MLREWKSSCESFSEVLTQYLDPQPAPARSCTCLLREESQVPGRQGRLLCPGLLARQRGDGRPPLSLTGVRELLNAQPAEELWVLNRTGPQSDAPLRFLCTLLLLQTRNEAWRRHDFTLPVVLNAGTCPDSDEIAAWVQRWAGRRVPFTDPAERLATHPEGYQPLCEHWRPDLFLVGSCEQLQAAKAALQREKKCYRRLVLCSLDGHGPTDGLAVELVPALSCAAHGQAYVDSLPMEDVQGDTRFKLCLETVRTECLDRKQVGWWACNELLARLERHDNTGKTYTQGEVLGGELTRKEYKQGQFVPRLLEYIVAFANGHGGVVVFGVREPNALAGEREGHFCVQGFDFKEEGKRGSVRSFDELLGQVAQDLEADDFTAHELFHVVQMPVHRRVGSAWGEWVAEVHVHQSPAPVVLQDKDTGRQYLWVRSDGHNVKLGKGMSRHEKESYAGHRVRGRKMNESMKRQKMSKAGFWKQLQEQKLGPELSAREKEEYKRDGENMRQMKEKMARDTMLSEEEYFKELRVEQGSEKQERLLKQKIQEIKAQRAADKQVLEAGRERERREAKREAGRTIEQGIKDLQAAQAAERGAAPPSRLTYLPDPVPDLLARSCCSARRRNPISRIAGTVCFCIRLDFVLLLLFFIQCCGFQFAAPCVFFTGVSFLFASLPASSSSGKTSWTRSRPGSKSHRCWRWWACTARASRRPPSPTPWRCRRRASTGSCAGLTPTPSRWMRPSGSLR